MHLFLCAYVNTVDLRSPLRLYDVVHTSGNWIFLQSNDRWWLVEPKHVVLKKNIKELCWL